MGQWKNLINQRFGTLLVEEYLGNSYWKCICIKCGNEIKIKTSSLNKNKNLGRDGCKHSQPIKIGQKYGYLTILDYAEDYIKPKSGQHERQWLCQCQCGRKKIILESNLKSFKSTSCGKCKNRISIPEKSIYYYLASYFDDIQENYRPNFLDGKEIDIYLPSIQIGIEYDGERWHKNLEKDHEKEKLCQQNGITLIHIREPKCPFSNEFQYCIITPKPTTNGTHMTNPINELINILNKNFSCSIDMDVDCLRDNADICKTILSTVGFNSLADKFPDIAKEWNYERNNPLTPNEVSAHAGKKVWWLCAKGHEYSSTIASRTGEEKCGCPICSNKGSGLYKEGKYVGNHSLKKEKPDIAIEFDENKNGISADEISYASNKKVWWKCKKCDFEWQARVNNRTSSNHTGCPNCAKKENKQGKTRIENLIKKYGSLLDNYPILCKEWDYEKNSVKPTEVTAGSHKKVWWICSEGHSYCTQINNRTNKTKSRGCPYCSKLNKK